MLPALKISVNQEKRSRVQHYIGGLTYRSLTVAAR